MTSNRKGGYSGLPAQAISSTDAIELVDGWELLSSAAGLIGDPTDLNAIETPWPTAVVPGTVASALAGEVGLDAHTDYDARDWWYQATFADPREGSDERPVALRFDGLATLAEVWLNGESILESTNMFTAHVVDITDLLEAENRLTIVFRSLTEALGSRRGRPRWKTKLVDNQKLRFFRTTLLGRIPSWTPDIAPVGPWRPVWLQRVGPVGLRSRSLRTDWSPDGARLELEATLSSTAPIDSATITVGRQTYPLEVDGQQIVGQLLVDAEPWWPHTHGSPTTYPCTLTVEADGARHTIDLGRVGFRRVELDRAGGDEIHLRINGERVFCRGACWTTNDIISLTGDPDDARLTLQRLAEANGNMVRVGGTMTYETDAFYAACDELGILVWQDFMFANMDYPVDDDDFAASVAEEARQQTARLSTHPSLVVFCGGSEVEQQAAMFGADRQAWTNALFSELLPAAVEASGSGALYWPSTPTGGALPFHTDSGLTHYYGVGAYKLPLEDCRLSAVKFTPECLGFSNLGEPAGLRFGPKRSIPTPVDPEWKKGIPRDAGAGWDFEDIRDHYVGTTYGVDPVELRSHSLDQYHRLSRTATGRVMARVFDEWRSGDHPCGGGLVWFLKDLRPGAGWGILDHENRPKPAYHYLRRAWAPINVALLPRGLSGLQVEVRNEGPGEIVGRLLLAVYSPDSTLITMHEETVTVSARSSAVENVEESLGHFLDPTYSYRFGPPGVGAVYALFESNDGEVRRSAMFWPDTRSRLPLAGLIATQSEDEKDIEVEAERLARDVRIDVGDRKVEDNYFDLPPGRVVTVSLDQPKGTYVEAENQPDGVPVRAQEP